MSNSKDHFKYINKLFLNAACSLVKEI